MAGTTKFRRLVRAYNAAAQEAFKASGRAAALSGEITGFVSARRDGDPAWTAAWRELDAAWGKVTEAFDQADEITGRIIGWTVPPAATAAPSGGTENGPDGFNCCGGDRLPWPAPGADVTCPRCGTVWEHDGVMIGGGARIKQAGS